MKESLVWAIQKLNEELKNCQTPKESLRIFCMRSANLFPEKKGIVTNVNKTEQGVLCKNGVQQKAMLTLPFYVENEKYFYQVFIDNDYIDEQKIKYDDIFDRLTEVLYHHFGKIEKIEPEKNDLDLIKTYKKPTKKTGVAHSGDVFFRNFYERDVLYDLMQFKVKEILLVASLYDAFTIETEGNFTQKILGDYSKLNLTSFPRVTTVAYYEDAYAGLCEKHFDLIIVMVGNDKKTPVNLVKKIRYDFLHIPIFLLLNNNADSNEFLGLKRNSVIDNMFIWNGDSRIFFSMIKLLEDKINLENDTIIGHTRLILLVEDTPRFYSRYLPELYIKIFEQTRDVMDAVTEADELYKVLSIRVRPKILLVSSYEKAIEIFENYKENFLSLITDVEFYRNGKKDKDAGIELVKYIKRKTPDIDIPIIVQSRDISNKQRANEVGCAFIYKNSETLARDIKQVLRCNMGFGDFTYRDENGQEIGYQAKNIDDFEYYLHVIPESSLLFHALRNHFSLWLMARGEIRFADILARLKHTDFKSAAHMRKFLITTVKRLTYEKTKGKLVEFKENQVDNCSTVVKLSSGALGGKGRGLVFINKLVYGFDIVNNFSDINIKTPSTFVIGTDTFDDFIEENNLREYIFDTNLEYEDLQKFFYQAWLDNDLVEKLRKIIKKIKKPLAVRSSGLFEDSLMQPFAGVFETYIIPNSDIDDETRLTQLVQAIKLVYASVFSPDTRRYIEAIDYQIEEEKMAVIIQEVVGQRFGDYYYPHIGGTAQSYNYYPFSYIKPEDGVVSMAVGLGAYVVGGGKTYHFSPKYPKLANYSLEDLVKNSQKYFYAVDLRKSKVNLLEGENAGLIKLTLSDAENNSSLKHLVSVYDTNSNQLYPGIDRFGPKIIDFANILKYDYISLSKTLDTILNIVKQAMGSPVEIEFAVDLKKEKEYLASLYLLQIKPLIGKTEGYEINPEELEKEKILFFTDNAMGNGTLNNITDVVYVMPETFDNSMTEQMASEIEHINQQMLQKAEKYILIAPGRMGTRDKWLGLPVLWSQISQAAVIIETSLPDFPVDASAGSHFFHNVVSMNVGYFSVNHNNPEHILNWQTLDNQKVISKTKFVKHVKFKQDLHIKMDGKKRIAVIEY